MKVKDANAPSKVKFSPSGNSHGYVSFSDVLKRASEFPEVVPVMFAPHGKVVAAFWLPLTHWFKFPPTGSYFRCTSNKVMTLKLSPDYASVRPMKVMTFKLPLTSSLKYFAQVIN